jgi:hypothetical protein
MNKTDLQYKEWLASLKVKVRSQLKAAVAANSVLIRLYWDLGRMISEKQTAWGSRFLTQLSRDLKAKLPDMPGFSETNLKYCKLFYSYFSIRPQLGDESKSEFNLTEILPEKLKSSLPTIE